MSRLRTLLPLLAATLLLLSAALYNGYPLTFWDTRAYVEHAGSLLPRPDRLIGYSLLIRMLTAGLSLWPVAIAQCLLVAVAVRRALLAIRGELDVRHYLALTAALSVGTALPWVAGQLMADIFTPLLVLALYVLTLAGPSSPIERCAWLALVFVCACVHLTHVPLGLALLAVAALVLRISGDTSIGKRVLPPSAALLAGVLAMGSFSYARTGKVTLAAGSNAFILAHLIESGIASRVLAEHCDERDYLLCAHREALPMAPDTFLWVDKLDLKPWENIGPIEHETRRLLHDSLREHFLLHLGVAADYTWRTFFRFRTGEGLDSDASYLIGPQLARFAPGDLPAYRAARQQRDALPIAPLRALHTPLGMLLLAIHLVALARALRTPDALRAPATRFLLFVLAALLLNAALSGNLAGVYDRYQSRLWWLLGVAVVGVLPGARSRATARS